MTTSATPSITPDLPHTRVLGYLSPNPEPTTVRRIVRITMWLHAPLLTLSAVALGIWAAADLYKLYHLFAPRIVPAVVARPFPWSAYLPFALARTVQLYAFLLIAALVVPAWLCAAWTVRGHGSLRWLGPIVMGPTLLLFALLAAGCTAIPFSFGIETLARTYYRPWTWWLIIGLPIFGFLALLTIDLMSCVRWYARNICAEISFPVFKFSK